MKTYKNLSEFKGAPNAVITTGTFDGVHLGHQKIIQQLVSLAKEKQGESIVFTFDPHPRHVIFPDDDQLKLLHNWEEKAAELEKLGVDHLIIHPFSLEFSRISATDYIRDILVATLQAKHLIVGYDHQFGRNREGDFGFLQEAQETYGFQVYEIPALDIDEVNVSSTKIRRALAEGQVDLAQQYLSRPYSLHGTVVQGNKIGTGIGFPTANLKPSFKYKLIPQTGVYAVEVERLKDNTVHKGVMNIGYRPTINETNPSLHLEVHLLDFSDNLYDENLRVRFIQQLRREKKFDSFDALKSQIAEDVKQAVECMKV